MANVRKQIIQQLQKYLELAPSWDIYEIAEWTFGYDDPLVEQFKEEIQIQDKERNESQRIANEAPAVQS